MNKDWPEEEELEAMFDKAVSRLAELMQANKPTSYAEGVCAALGWACGQYVNPPIDE